jgi:hypothetical protein
MVFCLRKEAGLSDEADVKGDETQCIRQHDLRQRERNSGAGQRRHVELGRFWSRMCATKVWPTPSIEIIL